MPDYQGLGIGHEFSSQIAQLFIDKGFRFIITSSTKSLFNTRKKDPRWIIKDKKRHNHHEGNVKIKNTDKYAYSYEYIGGEK